MFVQPQVFSHGLDASSSTCMIYYSQPNGEEFRKQSEDRVITMSDEKDVLIIDILCEKSVDEDAREGFLNKENSRQKFDRAVARCQSN